jgi:hypothetical protein
MSQKRALIAATLLAVNASEFFTQDMEDFVDADYTVQPAPAPAPAPARVITTEQPKPAQAQRCICTQLADGVPNPDCPMHGAGFKDIRMQPKPAQPTNGQQASDPPGFEVWADWSHVDHAIQWGLTTQVFDHENHARNAYAKCKTDCKPATAKAMWQCWYQDVQRRIADKAAVDNANAAADEHLDIDPPTAGDWLDG